jgi:subtilisin family serine protease
MRTYTVLRDLTAASTGEPYGGGESRDASDLGSVGLRVDVERLDRSDVRSLGRDPAVRAIAPVMPTMLIHPVDEPEDQTTPQATRTAWGVSAVGADRSSRTGAGVVVAVLDTGIDASHPAFAGVELTQADFSGSGNGDKKGHGTHCAGTVFGREVDGTRIGVAPGVTRALIGKVLGDDGAGDSEMIFRGLQWALDNHAQVISMSLGFDFPGLVRDLVGQGWPADLATSVALEAYRANLRMFDALMAVVRGREPFGGGCVLVAAAGNESRRTVDPDYEIAVSIPAAADGVVSVGALGESSGGLQVASFSNTFPQVSGPGVKVLSARPGGDLTTLSGTSMATPHVAGVAALWWEELAESNMPLSARVTLAKLLATATTDGLAAGVEPADRGLGLVQAP